MSVPILSVSLVIPARRSVFGVPPSTAHTCGLALFLRLYVHPGVRVDPLDPDHLAAQEHGRIRVELGGEGVVRGRGGRRPRHGGKKPG